MVILWQLTCCWGIVMNKINTITVVGLGVIGGSMAMRLSKLGYSVFGVDIQLSNVESAKKKDCIIDGSDNPIEFFKISDLVIMAIYPNQISNYVHKYQEYLKSGCIIIDVAGLKSHIVDSICDKLRDDIDFVFCHPMAGREKKGFDFADDKVFDGANFIITPIKRNNAENLELVVDIAKRMNFGRINKLTPVQHDQIIAFTSQLPHAIAVALINSDQQDNTGDYIGDSYRDLTRIANINEKLWVELFLNNRQNLLSKIEDFEKQLNIIKQALKDNDDATLEQCFIMSSKRRIKLENPNKKA